MLQWCCEKAGELGMKQGEGRSAVGCGGDAGAGAGAGDGAGDAGAGGHGGGDWYSICFPDMVTMAAQALDAVNTKLARLCWCSDENADPVPTELHDTVRSVRDRLGALEPADGTAETVTVSCNGCYPSTLSFPYLQVPAPVMPVSNVWGRQPLQPPCVKRS